MTMAVSVLNWSANMTLSKGHRAVSHLQSSRTTDLHILDASVHKHLMQMIA